MKTIRERFDQSWEYVPEVTCWIWNGSPDSCGYGRLVVDGKHIKSNRLSWMLHNGEIPDGMRVCHKCDTPACVNPSHLFLGTQKDNMRDMIQKGRNAPLIASRVRAMNAKLTPKEIVFIRSMKGVARASDLALSHGVCSSTVTKIWAERIWQDIR